MNNKPYVPFYKPLGMSDEQYRYEREKAEQRLYEWIQQRQSEYPRVLGYTISGKAFVQLGEEDKGTHLYVDEIAEGDYSQHFKNEVKTGWDKAKVKFEEYHP